MSATECNINRYGGVGILYLAMSSFMAELTGTGHILSAGLAAALIILFIILSSLTHLEQYNATYGLVYNEVKATRISLAEKLRRLPLSFFGKRDIADLTENIMGDVNRMEHVWSHVLGYLYGAYISTAMEVRTKTWT